MSTGMGAAMAGVGQATQALSSLPLVGSLAGSAGGLGARDIPLHKRIIGTLSSLTSALKVKRGTVDSALYPKLNNLPDMGSAGLVNLGGNSKRDAEPEALIEALSGLPVLGGLLSGGGLGGKVKRQLDVLTSLISKTTGGKEKRQGPTDLLKGLPVVGGLVGGKSPKVKRSDAGLDAIKGVLARVADIRGVTSKRSPEEGDFRQELRKANKAKVDGELSHAADKAERKIKIKNTKFPPNGGEVKSPQEALDKREETVVEKRMDLVGALPVKDIAESTTGVKSALDLLKNVNAAASNMGGK